MGQKRDQIQKNCVIQLKTITNILLLMGPYHTPGAMQRAGLKMRCVQAHCYLKKLKSVPLTNSNLVSKYFLYNNKFILYIAFPKLKGPSQ